MVTCQSEVATETHFGGSEESHSDHTPQHYLINIASFFFPLKQQTQVHSHLKLSYLQKTRCWTLFLEVFQSNQNGKSYNNQKNLILQYKGTPCPCLFPKSFFWLCQWKLALFREFHKTVKSPGSKQFHCIIFFTICLSFQSYFW